ncbi:LysM peptidoglycan-binding domain-containing protein [Emticicia sp. 21SJ11W-3]|uniref:LysM peptidoglycan-binding domain-containing protein n=1 Tax=Emticicia sp. 21SJ11W-3 TaxID=2916755 RepID=UPI00209D3DBF|nr:LysM peptidoglycan-binding domain-containing protein [Emticicia sp. 21SJ11W-3]UTA66812.1 LysM peptidoglycan-binding domain-containing protein [Emticicia sp. 21SJ11W-3]
MKRIFVLSFFVVGFQAVLAQQSSLPQVPKKVVFAGVSVQLDADAQALVEKEVSALLIPENRYVQDKLQRIQWYFPVIERILADEKVPDDFKYLAVVESSLLPDAVSSSNAVGFWQMKAPTAQELGLRVDNVIDERKNIYASTKAAARYLKRSNQIYKNWISSLYSYLLGAAGISKIVPSEWVNASSVTFNARTDRYLIKTIAARLAFEHRVSQMKQNEWAFFEYRQGKGKTLAEIAAVFEIDLIELKKHNSWLQTSTIPDDYSVALFVPANRLDLVQIKAIGQSSLMPNNTKPAEKETVTPAPVIARPTANHAGYPVLVRAGKPAKNDDGPVFYEINEKKGILAKTGDDVASLAKAGRVSVKNFLLYNDMTDADVVVPGKVYYLQRKYSRGPVAEADLKTGESTWELSQAYGVKLHSLLKYNRLNEPAEIREGQVVYLQRKRPKHQPLQTGIEPKPKPQEVVPAQPLPLMEKFDQKTNTKPEVLAKNTKAPEREVVREPQASETVVIERASKRPATKQPEPSAAAETKVTPLPGQSTDDEADTVPIIKIEDEKPVYTASTSTGKPSVTPKTVIMREPEADKSTRASVAPKKVYYRVTPGQNLYSIARKYNVSVRDLAEWNNFSVKERVKSGQQLIVGYKDSPAYETRETTVKENPAKEKTEPARASVVKSHKVVRGETLFSISKKYDVTMKQIQEWNNMTSRDVKIGQKLLIRKI